MNAGGDRRPSGLSLLAQGRGRSARHRGMIEVRWMLVALLVALLLTASGCKIEMALDTVLETDGSGSVGLRLTADKEILDLMSSQGAGPGDLFDEFQKGVPEGWDADSGTEADGTQWVSAKRLFDDPSDLESLFVEGSDGPAESMGVKEFTLAQDRGFFSTKTEFRAVWDVESLLSSTGEEIPLGMDLGAVSSIFEIQNRLTLPGDIKDNNADEVDGNTLIWRPVLAGSTEMYATSVAYRWALILGIAGAAFLVLVGLVVALVLLIVLPRRGGAAPQPSPAPDQPPSPGSGPYVAPVAPQPAPPPMPPSSGHAAPAPAPKSWPEPSLDVPEPPEPVAEVPLVPIEPTFSAARGPAGAPPEVAPAEPGPAEAPAADVEREQAGEDQGSPPSGS